MSLQEEHRKKWYYRYLYKPKWCPYCKCFHEKAYKHR